MTPNFDDYADKIRSLPSVPEESDVLTSRFLLDREDRLEVYYAPLHGITTGARVVIVGLTPGKSQVLKALQAARTLLSEGWRPPRIFDEIRRRMAFAGPMRRNLITMLDKIGVAERLDLPTTARAVRRCIRVPSLHVRTTLPRAQERAELQRLAEHRQLAASLGPHQRQPAA